MAGQDHGLISWMAPLWEWDAEIVNMWGNMLPMSLFTVPIVNPSRNAPLFLLIEEKWGYFVGIIITGKLIKLKVSKITIKIHQACGCQFSNTSPHRDLHLRSQRCWVKTTWFPLFFNTTTFHLFSFHFMRWFYNIFFLKFKKMNHKRWSVWRIQQNT